MKKEQTSSNFMQEDKSKLFFFYLKRNSKCEAVKNEDSTMVKSHIKVSAELYCSCFIVFRKSVI